MDRYTNLNLYGHLALELGSDNNSGGSLTNVPTSDISFLRFTGTNPVIHGLDPGHGQNNNKILVITFLGTGTLTFKHLSTSNSSNNFRIKTPNGEDYTVPINYGSILIYDSYDNFWHIVGEAKLAAGNNGEIQFNNGGALKGNSNLTWDVNNNILNVSGTTYSTALFDDGKRVATLTGTETLTNKTLVSPTITGTLTFGEIPFYQYGHHGISIFEDVDLSQSSLQTVYNFGTPDSEKSSVLSLSVKDEYKAFIGTAGYNSLNTITIGSTSNFSTFQIRKGTPIEPVDIVSGGTSLLVLNYLGQLILPFYNQSTSPTTGTLVVYGGAGINGQLSLNDNLSLFQNKTLKFYDSDSSNYVGIKSPSTVNSNYTLTLPSTDGTNGQTLTTNGSGTLSFETIDLTHNNLLSLQGGGGGNYYHSDQPINVADSVQFSGLNINGAYSLPIVDGTSTQVLRTNGSGALTFATIYHNVLPDLQGGGGGNYYHSDQPINVADSVQFSGLNINGAYSLPIVDGTNTQVLRTNGSGALTFATIYHNALPDLQGGGGGNYYHSDQPINIADSVQFSGIESTKEFKLSGDSTITTSGSLTSLSTTDISLIRYDSTSQGTLHGLADGVDGKIIIITNVNTGKLLLASDSIAESTTSNRILTEGDVNISVKYKSSVILQYDAIVSRWRIINRHAHNDSSELQGGDNVNYYHSNQPINTTDAVTFNNLTVVSGVAVTGTIRFNNIIYPNIDGTSAQVLTTNGSGTLSFSTITHNNIDGLQGGGSGNYYHSDQPINVSNSVQFSGININGVYSLPTVDGNNGQVPTTNGSGTLTFQNVLTDIIQDTTPQLGGNLDVNGFDIISTSNGNIDLSPNGTGIVNVNSNLNVSGSLTASNINYPTSDGYNRQVLATNGSGTLGFITLDSLYDFGNISSSSSLNLTNIDSLSKFSHTNLSSSTITLTNGIIGKTYKIIGNSNGVQYSFSASGGIKWPSEISPIISNNSKSDLFVFECTGTNKYIGYYFYNYDTTGLF